MTATPFLQMLMDAYDPAKHDPSSMRLWVCGGSAIPEAVVSQAAELLPACQTVSVYGRSENMITTMCTLDDPPAARSATSDGAAVNGSEVRIVDASTGVELPRGPGAEARIDRRPINVYRRVLDDLVLPSVGGLKLRAATTAGLTDSC